MIRIILHYPRKIPRKFSIILNNDNTRIEYVNIFKNVIIISIYIYREQIDFTSNSPLNEKIVNIVFTNKFIEDV